MHIITMIARGDQDNLYILWDWMQAIMGLLLDWNPIF